MLSILKYLIIVSIYVIFVSCCAFFKFLWCSGYHVRLTRGRSPVQPWVETSVFSVTY